MKQPALSSINLPLGEAPSADEVATRAYYHYVDHGSQPGHDVRHWLDAEAELRLARSEPGTRGRTGQAQVGSHQPLAL